ncbi:MAG: type II secretion system F family protein, partial [Planctomycetaceae bacterium]
MQFQYQAKTGGGETSVGLIDAETPAEARQRLRAQGLFTLSVEATQAKTAPRPRKTGPLTRGRVRKSDLLIATSQLAIMCQSGVDLAEAIHNCADNCPNPRLRTALETVYDDVSAGQLMSAALRRQVHIFGEVYVAGIAAGEASGNLTEILDRLGQLLRSEIRLGNTIRSTLAYPIVLVTVASVVMATLVFFVLPQFAQVFSDLGTPCPPLTQFLLDGGQFLREHVVLVLLTLGLSAVGLTYASRTAAAARHWDRFLLTGPM